MVMVPSMIAYVVLLGLGIAAVLAQRSRSTRLASDSRAVPKLSTRLLAVAFGAAPATTFGLGYSGLTVMAIAAAAGDLLAVDRALLVVVWLVLVGAGAAGFWMLALAPSPRSLTRRLILCALIVHAGTVLLNVGREMPAAVGGPRQAVFELFLLLAPLMMALGYLFAHRGGPQVADSSAAVG